MLTIQIKQGKGGRWRWFARTERRIVYSSFPRSFGTNQEAWEHAEWACGAFVTMRLDRRLRATRATPRNFTN